ncbi:MAG: DegT/DnrJ/EryC1/StrS family aminotransferase [Candidatus Competibacteraceae bacterium]
MDMDRLCAMAGRYRLQVIEDAALAIGSSWRGRRIGRFGDLTVFLPSTRTTTAIEGGALVLNDEAEAREVETLRFHGITRLRGRHPRCSTPAASSTAGCQRRIGLGQLARLEVQRPPPRTGGRLT